MPEIIKQLLNSEKAITMGVLVVCATVLAGLGKISWVDWQSYTSTIGGIYVGGKTITGVATAITGRSTSTPTIAPESK